ncbi:MAG: chloride channel protein [Planctomycetota bacterium]
MSLLALLRVRLTRLLGRIGFSGEWYLIPVAATIGTGAGLVAFAFEWLVENSNALFFERIPSGFMGLPWVVLLMPAIGGLAVGALRLLPLGDRAGPGIPAVVHALARKSGYLSARHAALRVVNASLTIGSGGSAGVEGPIIFVGSSVGSVISRTLHVGREHVHTLVGCGAAGAMAAIFNAPFAAVMFVLEVLLRDFSFRTFMPIVVSSVFGTALIRALRGENASLLLVPEAMHTYEVAFWELGPYAVLAVGCGLAGVCFAWLMRASDAGWQKVHAPRWLKPAIGGLVLGALGLVFVSLIDPVAPTLQAPPFFGNGYRVIEVLLDPATYGVGLIAAIDGAATTQDGVVLTARVTVIILLALLVAKAIGTAMTIGSGGAGGFFAPSLFLGAVLGGAFGVVLRETGLYPDANPAAYALAGMAGMIAAVAHCPNTAYLLVFELTGDYKVILPMMLVAVLAMTVAQALKRDSLYTSVLRDMGVRHGSNADMTLLRRLVVDDVPLQPAVILHPEEPASRLVELLEDYAATDFVVCDDSDHYTGMIVGQDLRTTLLQREAIPLMICGELARTNLPTVSPGETLDQVLDKFSQHDVASLAVVDTTMTVRGLLSRSRLIRHYQRLLEQ